LFVEELLPRQLLGSVVDEQSLYAESVVAGCEMVNLDTSEAGNVQLG